MTSLKYMVEDPLRVVLGFYVVEPKDVLQSLEREECLSLLNGFLETLPKGKIERIFGFMQDRLAVLLQDCSTLEEVNKILAECL